MHDFPCPRHFGIGLDKVEVLTILDDDLTIIGKCLDQLLRDAPMLKNLIEAALNKRHSFDTLFVNGALLFRLKLVVCMRKAQDDPRHKFQEQRQR